MRFALTRPRRREDYSITAAKVDPDYGVTGLTMGDVFGRAGSMGDFGAVGRTLAPAARAASPVVWYIATWADWVLARAQGPWSTSSMAAMVVPATIIAITPG